MTLNTKLENGKVALVCEILGIRDMQDVDLLNEFNQKLRHSFELESKNKKKALTKSVR